MKKTTKLITVLLALLMVFAVSAASAETVAAETLKNYEKFEEMAFYAEIPDSVMYVTLYSDESAPLYELVKQVGYTYDSFREFMSSNKVVAYGMFLTDYETEFQIAADRIDVELDMSKATEIELQNYLTMAGNGLEETANARIEDSGIYRGKEYTGFWFHYQIEANGIMQGVIQYSLLHRDRAINIRGYNMNGKYPEDAEEIIRGIFDSIIVN